MKYISEFRDKKKVKKVLQNIFQINNSSKHYRFMEFCGGHTHTIFKYGIPDVIPKNIEFVHGPGCPVCVLPVNRLDMAINLVKQKDIILCTYGDMMRVPGSNKYSLFKASSDGGDVRMVYSALECIGIAKNNPEKQVAFFAIGFETTTPPTAVLIQSAFEENIKNLSIFSNHVLTPSAVQYILDAENIRKIGTVKIDGFIGPGHVSSIIGTEPYDFFAEEYEKPVVITGFEPLDILSSIYYLIKFTNEKKYQVFNEYKRAVKQGGNEKAKKLVSEIFELRKLFNWRGLGEIPYSGLKIKEKYIDFDAEKRFGMKNIKTKEPKGCKCGAVLRGVVKPVDCPIFNNGCTPENPIGSCMVSNEGVCAAYYKYRKF